MTHPRPRRSAFTIVEMLVVVGIIALLMGLLLPALSGARKRARKTEELNHLRTIGHAWTMYANFNNDAALPGYVEPEVQGIPSSSGYPTSWKVTYKFPDHSEVPAEIAAPWVWRLMSYLDYEHEPIHFYLREDDPSMLSAVEEAEEIAETPAFGYNGLYVGGWWEMQNIDAQTLPRARFSRDSTGQALNVVSRSVGGIRRSSELVLFCSSGNRDVGVHKAVSEFAAGSHYVVPPFLATETIWTQVQNASVYSIQVFTDEEPVPVGRYTAAVAVLYADGHVDVQTIAGLSDMRSWIDAADSREWQHNP
ncbi:MAG: type II secretion system protein [Planctomycetota bacterium]|jgi:type II secretory pathway pseudopilin PulG